MAAKNAEIHIAYRHLLAAIDLAPAGTYKAPAARRVLYDRLVGEHTLESVTAERYGLYAKNLVQAGGCSIAKLFEDGSEALSGPYRKKIGYVSPSRGPAKASRKATAAPTSTSTQPEGSAKPETAHTASPKIRLTNTKLNTKDAVLTDVEQPSQSSKPVAGSKRKHGATDNEDAATSRPHKSPRAEVALTTDQSTTPSSPLPSPSSESPVEVIGSSAPSKRKRASTKDEDDLTAVRSAKSPRQTLPAAEVDGSQTAALAAQVSHALHAKPSKASNSKNAQPSTNTKAANVSQADNASKKRKHDLIEVEDDERGSTSAQPASKKARSQPDSSAMPEPGLDYMEAMAAKDPLGPHIHGVYLLGDGDIEDHLGSIWHHVQASSVRIMGNLDHYPLAKFVEEPQAQLASLYTRLFGKDWREPAALIGVNKAMDTRVLLEGCLAAAVWEWVHSKPASWPTARDRLEEMQSQELLGGLDEYFEGFTGAQRPSIVAQMWKAGRWQAQNPAFHERVLLPIAKELAQKLWTVMQPQLALSDMPEAAPDPKRFYRERLDVFTDIFKHALILKARMLASPDKFTPVWIERGVDFDSKSMEDVCPGKDRLEVQYCVSPKVIIETHQGDPARVCVWAKVFARPNLASRK